MQILAFGTFDEQSHPRIGVLMAGLRAHGHDVTACNVPLGLDTATRVALLRQPWRLPLLAARLSSCWLRLLVAARRGPRPDVVLVGYLGHFDVLLARSLFPRTTVVLDQLVFAADTAADRGVSAGVRPRLLRLLDRLACGAADLVLVDTPENAALAPAATDTLVVPVGAPTVWDHEPGGPHPGRPLRVIFFGLFTPLQGTRTIAAAARLLDDADVQLTMVGRGQDLAAARGLAGDGDITWIDWVAAGDLPAMVAEHDVCLGIFGTTPKAQRVVPNKVFQGAAAGRAVVTSDTPPQRRTLGDAARFVPAGDAVALAAELRRLAADRAATALLAASARTLAEAAFTPRAVTAALDAALRARPSREVPR